MCRNIRPLFNYDPPATEEEVHLAALQFVRKISGFTKPSKINEEIFDRSILRIEQVIQDLIQGLETRAKPKNREEEARKRRERSSKRFGD